eukprot:gene15443-19940_t
MARGFLGPRHTTAVTHRGGMGDDVEMHDNKQGVYQGKGSPATARGGPGNPTVISARDKGNKEGTERYKLMRKLGEGTYGVVYKGIDT